MDSGTFISALRALEERGDPEQLVRLYAEDARLCNPQVPDDLIGPEGARRFWTEYRQTFSEIRSEFGVVVDGDGRAALEWTSTGALSAGGKPVRYGGVTVLEWRQDRITRSAAYFDPRALEVGAVAPSAAAPARGPAEGAGEAAGGGSSTGAGGRADGAGADAPVVGGYGADSGFDPAVRDRAR